MTIAVRVTLLVSIKLNRIWVSWLSSRMLLSTEQTVRTKSTWVYITLKCKAWRGSESPKKKTPQKLEQAGIIKEDVAVLANFSRMLLMFLQYLITEAECTVLMQTSLMINRKREQASSFFKQCLAHFWALCLSNKIIYQIHQLKGW